MINDNTENNKVTIAGIVEENPELSHEVYGERFFGFKLSVPRLSETVDIVPVTVSEKFFAATPISKGDKVLIDGQFRSYNNFSGIGNRLILTVFVKNLEKVDDLEEYAAQSNVFLNGYICKPPVYRTTPFGREIADILLAVNRAYNKSDYIPCIAWGRNAKYANTLSVGDNISVWGRVQSRDYQKKISEEETEKKTAYEISVSKLEIV